ncbi:MAG: tetratricopeptide repeat protein [Bryobacteraceae bacterium]
MTGLLACALLLAADNAPERLIEDGHWKRAKAVVEPLYNANPNDARLNYLMSQIKMIFRDLDAATALGEKAVSLDGSSADYHHHLSELYGLAAQRAGMFKGFGLAKKFRKENEAALKMNPKHTHALFALMSFYFEAPGIIGGDKNKARATAEKILETNAAEGYVARFELAEKEKNEAAMEESLKKAVAADPSLYRTRAMLAGFYLNRAKLDEAERVASEALALNPGRVRAHAQLAAVAAFRGRFAELDSILARAEKQAPDDLAPYYSAGNVLLEKNQLEKAEACFRKYLTQEPEGNSPIAAAAHWRLGLVLEKQGKKHAAISELATAVKLAPSMEPAVKDLKRLKR